MFYSAVNKEMCCIQTQLAGSRSAGLSSVFHGSESIRIRSDRCRRPAAAAVQRGGGLWHNITGLKPRVLQSFFALCFASQAAFSPLIGGAARQETLQKQHGAEELL